MHKNNITKKIVNHWNNFVLPIEEMILTRTPEEACYKKIINPLLDSYRKNMAHSISLYSGNRELKTILTKRLACIENFVKLKKILANRPSINEHNENNIFFNTERNSLKQLTKELIKHNQYIQTHSMRLASHQIPEDHIQPLIFNILAEAFDHLAALDWNSMLLNRTDPNPEAFYPTCLSVLNAYETRLRCLRAEKERVPNTEMRLLCDKKILNTLENISITIYESYKTYNILLSTRYLVNRGQELNAIGNKSDIPLKQASITRKKRLSEDMCQNNNAGSFFKFKKSKLSPIKQATKRQATRRS